MAEINTCHALAPSGSLLHPRSDDSAVKTSSPPRDWSHRLCTPQAHRLSEHMPGRLQSDAQGHPSAPVLRHCPFHTAVLDEDPEPAS